MTRPPFDRWFDRFLDSWLAWHPITATLLGATDFDHTLPDYSRDANADRIARARALIAELDALPWQDHTEAQQYDRILARGALELLIWETNAPFFQTGNPVQHTTEAIVSVASLFWNETVPLGDRVEAAVARMRQIPAFLETARQVRAAPLPWTELAIRQANAGAEFFGIGLAQLAEERGIERPAFLEQAAIAAEAVAEHASWLGSVLAERRIGIHTVGAGAIDRYLHLGHVLPAAQTAEWWFTYAHEELVEATTELRELTRAIDWRNAPRALLRQLPAIHPTPETYASTFPAVWNWAREIAERAELLTWPDGPVAFKPIPAYERGIREVIDLPVYYGA
ncbi:MAG: DUF885 family protein, partial [Thermomicrobiales bacterium]|nr:DUF885 family protein [Thermomicrobiales bacterium]